MTAAEVRAIVREELRKALGTKPRWRPPCGRGSSPPNCYGSAVYGPQGCTCR